MQEPTTNTLIPCRKESVDFDDTHNLFIEAENLEALKILQKAYAGQVKMIYIDPPYNTGNDSFIYPDKFSETREQYARRVGDTDDNGYLQKDGLFQGALRKNAKDNGHYHSNWLNMMLPRLHLAKTLLSDDGVIFISIDDNEQAQLKLLCDEVFGEENFVGEIIWQSATDNNPRQITTEHEYIICYVKNIDIQNKWLITSEKAQRIKEKYEDIKLNTHTISEIQKKLREWINKNKEELKGVTHYNNVDDKGVYSNSSNSSNTKPGGYTFDIIHPITKKVCVKPDFGWRWTEETFLNYEKMGDVEWGKDETTQPHIKKRIDTVQEQLKSIYYEDGRISTKQLETLLEHKKIFDNPKTIKLIQRLISFSTSDNNDTHLILDFFSGSGTTAHAVMQLNAEDGGNRRYICVQLPEETDEKSEAAKAGFATIAEITKERIRRAGAKIKAENPNQNIDTGFKVFKLAQSHFKQWQGSLKNIRHSDPERSDGEESFNHNDEILRLSAQNDGIGTAQNDGIGTAQNDGIGTAQNDGIGTAQNDGIGTVQNDGVVVRNNETAVGWASLPTTTGVDNGNNQTVGLVGKDCTVQ